MEQQFKKKMKILMIAAIIATIFGIVNAVIIIMKMLGN